MAKNRKKVKGHIKHAQFSDHNFSSIESHGRQGKNLLSPYAQLENVNFSSWKDDVLPNMLWAAVVANALSRDQYLALFRQLVISARNSVDDPKNAFVPHNWLASLSREEFLHALAPIKNYPEAFRALGALRILDSIPGRDHWLAFLPDESPSDAATILAQSVAKSFDHQSQTATDLRWLKICSLIASGRMTFGPQFAEQLEEFRQYPDKGDMRSVRPSIRSLEMSTRALESGDEVPENVAKYDSTPFWDECRKKTECFVERNYTEYGGDRRALMDELTKLSTDLANYCDDVAPSTGVDARRDACFGIALYAISITMEAAAGRTHEMAGGRILLRTIVELLITHRYLCKKDVPAIWMKYRRYGTGQAKLAFLKSVREDELPAFISLDELHDLANCDTWMEFEDMSVGSWETMNLRTMAEEVGLKPTYDKYYTWASGFTHGHWAAVRDTVFATCLNPLHRFHRVLSPTRQTLSTLEDSCKLINQMLAELASLYPPYKRRIAWKPPAKP